MTAPVFDIDAWGACFLAFTLPLWVAAGVQIFGYLPGGSRRRELLGYTLVAMAGNLGLLIAQHAVVFYTCFAVMTFSGYGLVVHDRRSSSFRAGRVYLVASLCGEVMALSGIMLLAAAASSAQLDVMRQTLGQQVAYGGLIRFLILGGFGVKAGLVPLHFWLPLAHPAAPAPASAVLSGAMIKAGIFAWMRFLPLGAAPFPGLSEAWIFLGAAAAFLAVGAGLFQGAPKAVLAYSSISQMGFVCVALGVGAKQPQLAPWAGAAATLYVIHHAFNKAGLFLTVGALGKLPRGHGSRPWLLGAVALCGFSLAGGALTSGALAKAVLKQEIGSALAVWGLSSGAVLSAAAMGTAALMARLWWICFRGEAHGEAGRAGAALIAPAAALSLAGGLGAAWMPSVMDASGVPVAAASGAKLLKGSWPAFIGIAAVVFLPVLRRRPHGDPLVPLGDVVALFPRWESVRATLAFRRPRVVTFAVVSRVGADLTTAFFNSAHWFQRWPVGTGALLLVCLIFYAAIRWVSGP